MASDYESVLCVKNEVFVYKIPARTTNRGYRAADWTLDKPDWTGRMKVVAKGIELSIKLEDKNSGELFAQCPVEGYPGIAIEQVLDSSRYFVIRIQDGSGHKAFIGIGFADRGDSFDMLVAIQDHFKWMKREEKEKDAVKSQSSFDTGPKLDLGFKEGQTITINIGQREGHAKPRPRPTGGGIPGLLPPPPGGVKIAGPPRGAQQTPAFTTPTNTQKETLTSMAPPATSQSAVSNSSSRAANDLDFLLDIGGPPTAPPTNNTTVPAPGLTAPSMGGTQDLFGAPPMQTQQPLGGSVDPWGDFTGSPGDEPQRNTTVTDPSNLGNWIQF